MHSAQSNSTKPHILVTEVSEEENRYITQALSDQFIISTTPDTLAETPAEMLGPVNILVPFIHSTIGRTEMERMPELRLIATRSIGYDHIDLTGATERGIAVANVPGYGENAVAEHTFALLLTLTRKIHLALTRTQQGNYTLAGLRGIDLYGKSWA